MKQLFIFFLSALMLNPFLAIAQDDFTLQLESVSRENEYIIDYTYSLDGNAAYYERRSFDFFEQAYTLSDRGLYSYNDSNQLTGILVQGWLVDSQSWLNTQQTLYEYDSEGRQTYYGQFTYLPDLSEFYPTQEETHAYDENGNLLEHTVFGNQGGGYGPVNVHTYTYDAQNRLATTQFQLLLQQTLELTPVNSIEHTWPNDDLMIGYVDTWDYQNEVWNPSGMQEVEYENGRILERRGYGINNEDEFFITMQTTYTYGEEEPYHSMVQSVLDDGEMRDNYSVIRTFDATGNRTSEEVLFWNQNAQELQPISFVSTDFDTDVELSEIAMPHPLRNVEFYQNKVDALNIEQYAMGQVMLAFTEEYHYGPFAPSSIEESAKPKVHVYPNPASERVQFKNLSPSGQTRLEVFNLSGQRVIDQVLNSDAPVSISELPSGMYIYTLSHQGQISSGKLSKR